MNNIYTSVQKTNSTITQRAPISKTEKTTTPVQQQDIQTQEIKKQNVDKFVRSNGVDKPSTYSKKQSIDEIRAMEEKRVSSYQEMIRNMVARQGQTHNLEMMGLKLNVTQEDSDKAALSLMDGGEYSVDAVATRIVDMAKSLANGDKTKIGILREAVDKGFGEARKSFGKEMPGIVNKTYDEIMKRFDEWEKE